MIGFFKSNTVEKLANDSLAALSMFNKAVGDLKVANENIANEDEVRAQEVNRLTIERTQLAEIKQKNENFISRIEALLS